MRLTEAGKCQEKKNKPKKIYEILTVNENKQKICSAPHQLSIRMKVQ